jgi:DedD protein
MGLFSFGDKDDAPRRRSANAKSARGEPGRRRAERSDNVGKDTAYSADAMLLDPTLPEKQRARRRLVGAIALVIAAVVVLPMVLDSHPKPVTDDIAIDIPSRPVNVPPRANDETADTQAGVSPDGASGPAAAGVMPLASNASSTDAASGRAAALSGKPAQSVRPSASSTKPAEGAQKAQPGQAAESARRVPTPPSTAGTQAQRPAPAAKPTQMPAPSAANADSGTPAAPPGARFAVQLGVFNDGASARRWESKLKAAGVPAYVENRKQADGSTRAFLRAGPFPDRAAASAAIAKVREAGLMANAAE